MCVSYHAKALLTLLHRLVESELHDREQMADTFRRTLLTSTFFSDQGMTQALSKIWMPLNKFIPAAMAGLLRGDPHIAVGRANGVFEQFEKDKLEAVQRFYETRREL